MSLVGCMSHGRHVVLVVEGRPPPAFSPPALHRCCHVVYPPRSVFALSWPCLPCFQLHLVPFSPYNCTPCRILSPVQYRSLNTPLLYPLPSLTSALLFIVQPPYETLKTYAHPRTYQNSQRTIQNHSAVCILLISEVFGWLYVCACLLVKFTVRMVTGDPLNHSRSSDI